MLNWNAIKNATLHEVPYRWAFIQNPLTQEDSLELAKSYPIKKYQKLDAERYEYSCRQSQIVTPQDLSAMHKIGDDEFQKIVEGWIVQGAYSSNVDDLSEIWQKFIVQLQSSTYRQFMSQVLGLNLTNHLMRIFFRPYIPGDSGRLPHTDFPSISSVTQLFYFNHQWQPEWGGYLRVLSNKEPESFVNEIPPLINTSVATVFSENSWHMVSPVSLNAPYPRLTLMIVYWKPKWNPIPS